MFFQAPQGRGKIRAMSKMSARIIMLNHHIRGLLFHFKKKLLFYNWLLFFGKSIQKHPDSVCENDINNEQNVRTYYNYAKPLNEKLIISIQQKNVMLASIF